MNNLPEGYKKGIPRVSDIVSFVYPFDGNGKERYLKWLEKNGINEPEYLKTSQDIGTYIHQLMEDFINGVPSTIIPEYENEKVRNAIEEGIKYIKTVKRKYKKKDGRELVAEPVLIDKNERFQGSSDLVLINEKNKKVVVIDWKSFGIAKSFFSLPNDYKKPYDKIKKGRLQFSLYGETYRQKGYEVENLFLVYLHDSKAYEYFLEPLETSEIEMILTTYEASKSALKGQKSALEFNIDNMFEIEIRTPTEQYGFVNIKANLKDLDNGKTTKENLESMIKTSKYLKQEIGK